MSAVVVQEGGLTLSIAAVPAQPALIDVRLQGTGFQAQITLVNEPLEGTCGLGEFLGRAADLHSGVALEWRSACWDLTFQATAGDLCAGMLTLKVVLWSTSDDDCDWQVKASLLLTPDQLRCFARAVLLEGPGAVF